MTLLSTDGGSVDDGRLEDMARWQAVRLATGRTRPDVRLRRMGLVSLTGLAVFWWFGPLFIYGLMPVLDVVIGDDPTNPPDSVLGWLEARPLLPLVHLRLPASQYVALGGRGTADVMQRVHYPQAARALLSATLLDAVDDLVREQGWTATTMAQVATAAGLSRQTVYNEFGSRQGLAEAYVLREVDTLLNQVERTVRTLADDPQAALLADSVVRLGISHAVLPTGTPDEAAAAMSQLLGPYVASLFTVGSVTTPGRAAARQSGS